MKTPFSGGVNALCWPRTLQGNFSEVVEHLFAREDIDTLDDARLKALPLSAGGRAAVEKTLLEDQQRLRALGLSPVLDCIRRYPRDAEEGVMPTDVYSFLPAAPRRRACTAPRKPCPAGRRDCC